MFRLTSLVRLLPLNLTWHTRIAHHRNTHNASAQAQRGFEILFLGRDEFSCSVFRELHEAKEVWTKLCIATQPNIKGGRHRSQPISPLKVLGKHLGVEIHEIPPDRSLFKTWQPPAPFSPETPPPASRMLITASFGRILPKRILDLFVPGRRLNVHPSLLPDYRGPAPIQHTILDGRQETGVSVIEMMERRHGIDAGDIWGQRSMSTPAEIDFPALRDSLAIEGGRLLVSVLKDMLEGKAIATPQKYSADAPHASLITPEDARLVLTHMTAADIVRRHKAISHQRPVFATLRTGKILQLHEISVLESPSAVLSAYIPDTGMAVYHPPTDSLAIRCAEGTVLSAGKLRQQDRALLTAKQWWNGVGPDMRVDAAAGNKSAVFLA